VIRSRTTVSSLLDPFTPVVGCPVAAVASRQRVATVRGRVRHLGGPTSGDGGGLGQRWNGLGAVKTTVWLVAEAQIVRIAEGDIEQSVENISRGRSTVASQHGALALFELIQLTTQYQNTAFIQPSISCRILIANTINRSTLD